MLRKSLKYLAIATINAALLAAMLWIWADKLELIFNDSVLIIETLKIIGCTIASLIAMRIVVYVFSKKNISNTRTKISIASVLTFLISSYLYTIYFVNITDHKITDRKFRQQIVEKTKYTSISKEAAGLSYKEYAFIAKLMWFPEVDSKATNISFSYQYDDFLPDYSFSLRYDAPKGIKLTPLTYTQRDLSKNQTIDTVNGRLKVHYLEILQ